MLPLQLLVANLDYSEYHGRLALGRIFSGTLRRGDEVAIAKLDGSLQKTAHYQALRFRGSGAYRPGSPPRPGDIVAIAGVEGITIGETVTSAESPAPLPHIPD